MAKIYIKNLEIDNKCFEEKEITIYPLNIISTEYNYIYDIVWYITDFHFFNFYRINDYETLLISKIISGIIEHYQYSAYIDNEMLIECVDFVNEILDNNKNNILKTLFAEHSHLNIEKLNIKYDSINSININSSFNDDSNIIEIIFIYNEKSFSSKVFFSRKIDVFISVLQSIIKILLTNNLYSNVYISDYDFYNIDLENANSKNLYTRDFIFKVNELSIKEDFNNIKNRNDLIEIFFKYYNSNMFIENFSLEESNKYLIDIFKSRIKSGRNIYITTDNIKSFEDIANIL
ncbi:hypothetical protein [uncultured Brachyspira sp.]|uniref:hypothetical protein n=1 Tax=uncultured Brachyspira sp. TaxID=221953 RepID=UPI002617B5D7|nr:hypothetical protein [uncultured Brachyspira sp.]